MASFDSYGNIPDNVFMNKNGQTSVEYVLMLAVVVLITLTTLGKVKDYMVGQEDCPNESLVCRFLSDGGLIGNYFRGDYQYFTIRR